MVISKGILEGEVCEWQPGALRLAQEWMKMDAGAG